MLLTWVLSHCLLTQGDQDDRSYKQCRTSSPSSAGSVSLGHYTPTSRSPQHYSRPGIDPYPSTLDEVVLLDKFADIKQLLYLLRKVAKVGVGECQWASNGESGHLTITKRTTLSLGAGSREAAGHPGAGGAVCIHSAHPETHTASRPTQNSQSGGFSGVGAGAVIELSGCELAHEAGDQATACCDPVGVWEDFRCGVRVSGHNTQSECLTAVPVTQ